jgi:rod shape-determining protein MreD
MATIISIPTLFIIVLFQIAAISRIPILHGTADLMLLTLAAWGICDKTRNAWLWALVGGVMVSFTTAMPWPMVMIPYGLVLWLAQILHNRFWQSPILTLLLVTIIGTIFQHAIYIIFMRLTEISFQINLAMASVTMPSLIINLILAIPIYSLMKSISHRVYPIEEYE